MSDTLCDLQAIKNRIIKQPLIDFKLLFASKSRETVISEVHHIEGKLKKLGLNADTSPHMTSL